MLSKITLVTNEGKEIELTMDEARELHRQLDSLFGLKYIPPVLIPQPQPQPQLYPYRYYYDVTCQSTSGDKPIYNKDVTISYK